MPKFLAIYTGSATTPPEPAVTAKGGQAWGEWIMRNGGRIVDPGGPLGRTKKISAAGIEDARNTMSVYTVVEADDHEAAARLFENHPHFAIFPGDGVEVMPVMPIPSF